MSRLAHAALGAPGFATEKRAAHEESQAIIVEAKRIQRELGCTWTEALHIADRKRPGSSRM